MAQVVLLDGYMQLTLLHSKKKSNTLLKRFNGFKLIKATISKSGEFKVYEQTIKVLSDFLFSLEQNKDNAICLTFFDANTNYLDIHYLAKKKYEKKSFYEPEDFEFYLEILTNVNSPLMKKMMMDTYIKTKEVILVESLREMMSDYNDLFERSKKELKYFLDTEMGKELKKATIYTNLNHYGIIYNLLSNDENYADLLVELKHEIKSLKDPDKGNMGLKEWSIRKILGKIVTYEIEDLGEAYKMIYAKKNQK